MQHQCTDSAAPGVFLHRGSLPYAGAAMAGYAGSAGGNTPVSSGEQFGVQFVGMLCILLWTLATSGIMFFALNKFSVLRVDEKVEVDGLDITEHGGLAYRFSPNSIINATSILSGLPEKVVEKLLRSLRTNQMKRLMKKSLRSKQNEKAIEVSEIKTNEFKSNESEINGDVKATTHV